MSEMISSDYFFYYGLVDQRAEISSDITQGVMQPKRSLFYDRSFGAGISEYENTPGGLSLEVGIKYDIASWIAQRNSEVSDGSNDTRDRRAVASQGSISVEQNGTDIDVAVLYIPYFDYQTPGIVSTSLTA